MGIPKGEEEDILDKDYFRPLPPLVVGRVRETYETFPGGSLHTFSPARMYDRSCFLPVFSGLSSPEKAGFFAAFFIPGKAGKTNSFFIM